MTNIQAAIGLAQMERVAGLVARKRAIAARYRDCLAVPGLTHPVERPDTVHSHWMSSLLVPETVGASGRDAVMARLAQRGIETRPFFVPLPRLPVFCQSHQASTPVAEALAARGLNLPSAATLSDATVDRVCEAVRDTLKELEHG